MTGYDLLEDPADDHPHALDVLRVELGQVKELLDDGEVVAGDHLRPDGGEVRDLRLFPMSGLE